MMSNGKQVPILRLKRIAVDYAAILHPLLSEPELYEHLGKAVIPSQALLERNFVFAAEEKSPDNDKMIWMYRSVVDLHDTPVGVVEIGIFPDRFAEIGFMTFKPFQSRGYAPIYCQLAIEEARVRFGSLSLHASVSEHNEPSRKVLETLGFKIVAVNKDADIANDKVSDELVYRLDVGTDPNQATRTTQETESSQS